MPKDNTARTIDFDAIQREEEADLTVSPERVRVTRSETSTAATGVTETTGVQAGMGPAQMMGLMGLFAEFIKTPAV